MRAHDPGLDGDVVGTVVADAFRQDWGRITAALIHQTGDWDLAEECAQDAFTQALRRWPRDGVPNRPGAWLMTVARNWASTACGAAAPTVARLRSWP
jgi:RNA polymerase sigma-70 factor, ECF subfamily